MLIPPHGIDSNLSFLYFYRIYDQITKNGRFNYVLQRKSCRLLAPMPYHVAVQVQRTRESKVNEVNFFNLMIFDYFYPFISSIRWLYYFNKISQLFVTIWHGYQPPTCDKEGFFGFSF